MLNLTHGYEVFQGKIADMQRRTVAGFARGEAVFQGISAYTDSQMVLQFQNEHEVLHEHIEEPEFDPTVWVKVDSAQVRRTVVALRVMSPNALRLQYLSISYSTKHASELE